MSPAENNYVESRIVFQPKGRKSFQEDSRSIPRWLKPEGNLIIIPVGGDPPDTNREEERAIV